MNENRFGCVFVGTMDEIAAVQKGMTFPTNMKVIGPHPIRVDGGMFGHRWLNTEEVEHIDVRTTVNLPPATRTTCPHCNTDITIILC